MKFFITSLVCTFFLPLEKAQADSQSQELVVKGWPLIPDLKKISPLEFGNDPVLARLVCPPLTRFNAQIKSNQPLVFKTVKTIERKDGSLDWRFYTRTGIYWWNGKEVQNREIVTFLDQHLKEIILRRGNSLWKIPSFTVTNTKDFVQIQWKTKPAFGPYAINNTPLFQQGSSFKKKYITPFQCAGLYFPTQVGGRIQLRPTEGFKIFRPRISFLAEEEKPDTRGKVLQFLHANSLKSEKCPFRVTLPLMTVIEWNPKSPLARTNKLRSHIASLIGKRAFSQTTSGPLGNPAFGLYGQGMPQKNPIPSAELEKITAELPPQNTEDQKVVFRLKTQSESSGLSERVIADMLAMHGIHTLIVHGKNEEFDGELKVLKVFWPELDHTKLLTKAFVDDFGPFQVAKTELEKFAVSLTFEKPNLDRVSILNNIIEEWQPLTSLTIHNTCLKISKNQKQIRAKVDPENPDWFKLIVM